MSVIKKKGFVWFVVMEYMVIVVNKNVLVIVMVSVIEEKVYVEFVLKISMVFIVIKYV